MSGKQLDPTETGKEVKMTHCPQNPFPLSSVLFTKAAGSHVTLFSPIESRNRRDGCQVQAWPINIPLSPFSICEGSTVALEAVC